ncbi:MAG: DUF72 domain-containing protein [Thermoplasmata archaeon]|nr:MAG: DUF72 domain-containing protein [Thermoplasmata archaeon]
MIKVGCCGIGRRIYSSVCCGEVQQTFYDFVSEERARKWRSAAPNFEFTVKALQIITHPCNSPTYRRMKKKIGDPNNYGFFKNTREVIEAYEHTIRIADVLGARILIFQAPSRFKWNEENEKNLRDFFSTKSDKFMHFIELRGKWDRDIIAKICEEHGIGHCTDPFAENPARGIDNTYYLRLHGSPPGKKMYSYEYTEDDLSTLYSTLCILQKEEKIYASGRGRRRTGHEGLSSQGTLAKEPHIYVMFNNIKMVESALLFMKIINKKKNA